MYNIQDYLHKTIVTLVTSMISVRYYHAVIKLGTGIVKIDFSIQFSKEPIFLLFLVLFVLTVPIQETLILKILQFLK